MELERIDGSEAPTKNEIEITHVQGDSGWADFTTREAITGTSRLVYLGKCEDDGDMFVGYWNESVLVFKGYLNNGVIPTF